MTNVDVILIVLLLAMVSGFVVVVQYLIELTKAVRALGSRSEEHPLR